MIRRPLVLIFLLGMMTSTARGEIIFAGDYSENFNTLASSGTNAWTDDTTVVGWFRNIQSGNPLTYIANNGSTNTGSLYSFGTTGSGERALGSISSGTPVTIRYGVALRNATSEVINSVSLDFFGEQWRNGGNTAVQSLTFDWKVEATLNANGLTTGTFTAAPAFNFNSPITGATATALDGNLAANRTNIVGDLSGLNWGVNQILWLRFTDVNDAGNDHGLAIDDFNVRSSAVPEPSVMLLSGMGVLMAGGAHLAGRRRTKAVT
jgi:hypothetical protein